jgi:glycerophosphoryl diester phosphodiesterase
MGTMMAALPLVLLLAAAAMPQLVAHRGASAAAPENTVAAFRAAWREGADAIENDWRLTRDGHPVCLHDTRVDRTTDGKGAAAELTFEQVRALDAGRWKGERWAGEKVPTLGEMLAAVPPGKRTFLDVKAGPEIVPALAAEIEAASIPAERVAIIAFDSRVIAAAKKALPRIKAYWLYAFERTGGKWSATADELIEQLRASGADGLDVGLTADTAAVVNAELAGKLAAAGLELLVWTIDDPALARKARDLGARAITTNTPAALRAALRSRR